MLESLTIVHRGGIILYQYVSQPSIINTVTDGVAHTRRSINEHLISKILLEQQQQRGEQQHGGYSRGSSENDDNSTNNDQNAKSFHIADGLTYVWLNGYDILRDEDNDKSTTNNNKYYDDDDDIVLSRRRTTRRRSCPADVVDSSLRFYKDLYCVALYPDILFEGPRQYLKSWSNNLIYTALKEYILYHQSMTTTTTKQMTMRTTTTTKKNNNNNSNSSSDNDNDDQRDDDNNNSVLHQHHDGGGGEKKNEQQHQFELIRPDPKPFDKIFRILLQQSKTQKQQQQQQTTTTSPHQQTTTATTLAKQGTTKTTTIASSKSSSSRSSNENKKSSSSSGGGKAKTHWGEAKVTERAMAELDMSKKKDSNGDDNDNNNNNNAVTSGAVVMDSSEEEENLLERQLQEARATYLPSANEVLQQQQMELQQEENVMTDSWTSHITNLFDKKWMKTGTVLTDDDLDQPIQKMEQHLKSKNVSNDIAQQLCMSCRKKLRGKTLNSLYRIQTAIIQSLEPVLERILYNDIDLIRNVIRKRGDYDQGSFFGVGSSSFSSSTFFGNPGSSSGGVGDTMTQHHTNPITGTTTNIIPGVKRPPYVIVVMGINGIGKTTTIAKLAYYFVQNQCKPLLVAGDTFRSGAIEQLRIHGKCLNVPIYNEGYSKDPSLVTKSAIRYATENGHDVVLVDTAGRMQNNIPLMKAITKLVTENKPDFICLVCEALVGHDGIHQYTMFQKAVASASTSSTSNNNNNSNNTINGFILTKYDTVSDKVGAVLTLTYQTKTPILFLGIGQKYNHLQKISVKSVVQNLLT